MSCVSGHLRPKHVSDCVFIAYCIGSVKNFWNDDWWRKSKNFGGKPLCYLVHHKSHTDCPGIEPGTLQQEANDCLFELWNV
jgi:hypothetical protein